MKAGTLLDGVHDVESLRGRCVIDEDTGCWHLRDSRGRPLVRKAGYVPCVFVHQLGRKVTSRRAAWLVSGRGEVPDGLVLTLRCRCWDCANPEHVVAMPKERHTRMLQREGVFSAPAKVAAARRVARQRPQVKLTEELAQWARESPQTQAEVAHALGTRQNRISDIRRFKLWRPVDAAALAFDQLLKAAA